MLFKNKFKNKVKQSFTKYFPSDNLTNMLAVVWQAGGPAGPDL